MLWDASQLLQWLENTRCLYLFSLESIPVQAVLAVVCVKPVAVVKITHFLCDQMEMMLETMFDCTLNATLESIAAEP